MSLIGLWVSHLNFFSTMCYSLLVIPIIFNLSESLSNIKTRPVHDSDGYNIENAQREQRVVVCTSLSAL